MIKINTTYFFIREHNTTAIRLGKCTMSQLFFKIVLDAPCSLNSTIHEIEVAYCTKQHRIMGSSNKIMTSFV